MARNDQKLLRRIATGDDAAFSAFYRAHLNAVVAFFRRRVPDAELAFDLTAETFAVVAARADTYDGSGPPAAWLYGIARNKLRETCGEAGRGRGAARAAPRPGPAWRRVGGETMKDAFDDLERDLRAAVRARRRPRLVRTPLLALVAALVLGGGGAVAATQIKSSPDERREGLVLAERAINDTRDVGACSHEGKPEQTIVTDIPVLPAIARALPALTKPDPNGVVPVRSPVTGRVLRDTARMIPLAGGVRLRVYVLDGPDLTARTDPRACLAARRARVAELAAGRSQAVRAAAERRLMEMRDTAPGLQTLWVVALLHKGEGGFGAGLRLRPDDRLGPGIVSSGSIGRFASGGRRYVGIADPRTARVLVDPAHGRSKTVHVHQGFYSFALPRGSGHVDLREVDSAGATVREFPLRG